MTEARLLTDRPRRRCDSNDISQIHPTWCGVR